MPFVALTFCFWHTFILIDADLLQKGCVHFTLVLLPLRLCCVEGTFGLLLASRSALMPRFPHSEQRL